MYIPNSLIHTISRTRAQQFQEALTLLKAKVAEYMNRPATAFELTPPRDEVGGLIFATAEEIGYEGDDRSILMLAVEDLSLAQMQPTTFEALAEDDEPPCAEYLIRTKFEEWINGQLSFYVREHPLCCEICGREPAVWFWFPHANDMASSPELLTGDQRWGIGHTCKAVLESGEPLRVIEHDRPHTSASVCLIPIEQEQEGALERSEQRVIGTVPGNYQTLAQRFAQIEALFDSWLDQVAGQLSGKMPEPQEVQNAIVSITLTRLPNLYRDPLHLVLLALEELALATRRPEHYGELVEANSEDITGVLLLWCALTDLVSTRLHQRWQQRQLQMGQ